MRLVCIQTCEWHVVIHSYETSYFPLQFSLFRVCVSVCLEGILEVVWILRLQVWDLDGTCV